MIPLVLGLLHRVFVSFLEMLRPKGGFVVSKKDTNAATSVIIAKLYYIGT